MHFRAGRMNRLAYIINAIALFYKEGGSSHMKSVMRRVFYARSSFARIGSLSPEKL